MREKRVKKAQLSALNCIFAGLPTIETLFLRSSWKLLKIYIYIITIFAAFLRF